MVVIDQFTGTADAITAMAAALAPFPQEKNSFYPGVRRALGETDGAAFAYAHDCCRRAAQFIFGAFGIERFTLLGASFSMVTARPETLLKPQRGPHFDSTDQKYLALLHYLHIPSPSGTAFFRQRSTGIERVTEANVDRFVATAEREVGQLPDDVGYIQGSNDYFEQIGEVEAVPDRMLIYQGSQLHSGVIPADMPLSADPNVGRLTANFFVRGA